MAEGETAVVSAADAPMQDEPSSVHETTSEAPVEASNTLKRKQSPEPDQATDEPSKKPRLSPEPEPSKVSDSTRQASPSGARAEGPTRGQDGAATDPEAGAVADRAKEDAPPPKHTKSPPPPSRRKSQPVDERKRGRRLFGAVLGALGQNASPALARRREIDLKQREKLKTQVQEEEGVREERLARLAEVRRAEQHRFDERSMRIRHENMRATARALRTETEPRLYYRPWRLRPEEEEKIDQQVKEAEDLIEREKRAWDERHGISKDEEPDTGGKKTEDGGSGRHDDEMKDEPGQAPENVDGKKGEEAGRDNASKAEESKAQDTDMEVQPAEELGTAEETGSPKGDSKPVEQPPSEPNTSRRDDSDDDGGDEEQDVDGDDAVIY